MPPVDVRPLAVPDAYECTPHVHPDDRGAFLEWFRAEPLAALVGHRLVLEQANHSVSRAGVLRGLHFSDVPPSQAKYVYCPSGRVLDVVVDIRVGSPTFGAVDAVVLDDVDRRAVYVAEGLGHAFLALAEGSSVTYLCSTGYAPGREHGTTPLDPALGVDWDEHLPEGTDLLLSEKDRAAPTLAEARTQGLLPRWEDCRALYASLAAGDEGEGDGDGDGEGGGDGARRRAGRAPQGSRGGQ